MKTNWIALIVTAGILIAFAGCAKTPENKPLTSGLNENPPGNAAAELNQVQQELDEANPPNATDTDLSTDALDELANGISADDLGP